MRAGLVDIHIHGQGGLDVMSGDPDDLLRLSLRLASQGIAGFLATFVSSPRDETLDCLEAVKRAMGREQGAKILGVHLEGPFLHPQRKGAHNPHHLRPPDLREVREWVAAGEGTVKLVTIAPERPGAKEVIRYLVRKGIRVSMGHTTATFEQAAEGKTLGATSVTHLFNAMNALHHREPGLAGFSLLDPDLYTEVIGDGVHLSDETVRLICRCRPSSKVILISDGCYLTGLKTKGSFSLGGLKIKAFPDGSLRKLDGTLAASNASLRDIVDRILGMGLLPPREVVAMASSNPLAMLGLSL